MAASLQNELQNLHSCLSGDDLVSNATKAHDVTKTLAHICLDDVTEKDIGECQCRETHLRL